ncbi:MAG: glycosyltransferase family 2 protein [Candidatus Omnitrophica bacterium]|jgi:glycosyltransferase involved in cell wall biosynthesis|nr:glycosyltransferase family 2 protein [Candidatus Omnitrophota bacterium]
MNNKIDISVIMPALNEEKNIRPAINNTLKAFDEFKINGEIVVVNDGSDDKTEEIILELKEKEKRLKLIKHTTPRGIGASFWEGVDCASGDAVVMLPGDNENDPWETFRYASLLNHVDAVIPFVFNRQVRSFFRNALSCAYRFIVNSTFGVNFNYTNGTILYRKSILSEINCKSTGFFFQTEILIKVAKRGYLFAEVPYRLGLRPEGISKAVTFPSFLKVAKGYLRLVKDIYFDKNVKAERGNFSKDSQSAKRYNSINN